MSAFNLNPCVSQLALPYSAGHSFGEFERHTTGFGSRMLARMGYLGEGAGVGKDHQGIAEPVVRQCAG